MNPLAKFIQQQRITHKHTQAILAREIGVSRPTYVQIEQGTRDLSLTEAKKLADIFNMTLDQLIACEPPQEHVMLEKTTQQANQKIAIRVPQKNLAKFKQVLLYLLEKVGGKPNVGETVIYKLLYFIDFDYYEKFEETLVGATYIKNQYGPTPIEFKTIVQDMKKNGELEEVKSRYFVYPQKKYLALKRPDLSLLTGREIEHIDEVLARLADKNAKEISDYSHGDIPWLTHKAGEIISYETVFYRDEKYSVRNYDDEI